MPHSSALTAHRAEQHICQVTQNPVAQPPVCMFPGGTSNVNSPKDPTTLNSCCIAGQSYLRSPLTSVHKTVHGQHASAHTKYSEPPPVCRQVAATCDMWQAIHTSNGKHLLVFCIVLCTGTHRHYIICWCRLKVSRQGLFSLPGQVACSLHSVLCSRHSEEQKTTG